METIVRLLRPLVEPLLALSFKPPHLPEGSELVRHLRPSESWLLYRYLATLFGLLGQVVGTGVAAIAILSSPMGKRGWVLIAALIALQAITLAFALVVTRVDFELRHYLVGNRSLRASMGAWTRKEVTLSYANVQNVEVTQGPFERLFGFKSLILSTAGADTTPHSPDNLHVITLVGLDDADGLKSLIMGMLRHHKDSGLGDTAPVRSAGLDLLPVLEAARRLERAAAALPKKSETA